MDGTSVLPYRLKVRLGGHEFEAEGPEDSVKEQFQLFVTYAGNIPAAGNGSGGKPAMNSGNELPIGTDPIDEKWMRAYMATKDQVSLHVLPQTKTVNADGLVLLIYGYQKLLQQESVKSTDLMDAAKQSGLRIDRIDRNLPATHKALVNSGGSGKGSRYSLNNRGMAYAQELLEQLYE